MSTYLVTFTPAGPYFFGNEKTFSFDKSKSGSYYIISEDVPSQSSVLGSLRFLMLPYANHNFAYTDAEKAANAEAAGKASFDIDSKEKQSFGKIKNITPLFLLNGNNRYIPVPCNHISGKSEYTPFTEKNEVKTPDGQKYYFEDYDVKSGLSSGWLNLNNMSVTDAGEIIKQAERTGNNRSADNDGFFKRQYKYLKKGFSFAVYADIDADIDSRTEIVTMGQCKSPFSVKFEKAENDLAGCVQNKLSEKVKDYTMIYCLGDAVLNSNPCDDTLFAAFFTKDYRAFKTTSDGKVSKGTILHRLVKAGAVFITDNPENWIAKHKNENAEQIGFNNFVIIGGTEK